MPQWILDLLKTLLTGGVFTLAIELIRNLKRKKREAAEVSNIYKEGDELNITIRTNIDKYVEEKTKSFKDQVSSLEATIIQISTKYRTDLEQYLRRMSDLEQKYDAQLLRTKQVEDELNKERQSSFDCARELQIVKERLSQLEKK